MKIGTRSVLFGAHQFAIHPWFVARAWWKLYGFPWDPRLWVAFFVHDLGYLGKPNMDGPEGEEHVWLGARIMSIFDWFGHGAWMDFTLYHSRFYAKKHGMGFSRLCVADKLSICLTPWWLYLPLANLSGEVHEYLALHKDAYKYKSIGLFDGGNLNQREWWTGLQAYMQKWVDQHKDGRTDTWTPGGKADAAKAP